VKIGHGQKGETRSEVPGEKLPDGGEKNLAPPSALRSPKILSFSIDEAYEIIIMPSLPCANATV
jgi:hypothetical protein